MRKIILLAAIAVVTAMSFISCDEEERPSKIPTMPSSYSIADGATIEDTFITLLAEGSTTESGDEVWYDYYLGTSEDNMQYVYSTSNKYKGVCKYTDDQWQHENAKVLKPSEINEKMAIQLEPFTQYFWCAKLCVIDKVEETPIRTFYCVPQFSIDETDNGDGEWAAVLRFNKQSSNIINHKGGKVTLKPNVSGYSYVESYDIPAGQDSCYIARGSNIDSYNTPYVQGWDDEHGKFYEPIIYTFDVELKITVGDKDFTVKSNSVQEIILDKQRCVRDCEFNVYRVVNIGTQTWLADDLRTKSYYDEKGELTALDDKGESPEYQEIVLPSGSVGVLYRIGLGYELVHKIEKGGIPKGYHISTDEDWLTLEKYYGSTPNYNMEEKVNSGSSLVYLFIPDRNPAITEEFRNNFNYGEDVNLKIKLMSQYDWKGYDYEDMPSLFNAKPFGTIELYEVLGVGEACRYYVNSRCNDYYICCYRLLTPYTEGITRVLAIAQGYSSIRLVKD